MARTDGKGENKTMMGRALLIVGWIATLGIVATAFLGYSLAAEQSVATHLLTALISCLLLLFSHCWIMFYLIGTGKAIKEAVASAGLSPDLIEKTKEYKNRSYPSLMLAMGLAMVTFILGGGVVTRVIPVWVHHGLFLATIAVQVRTLLIEGKVLVENEKLMSEVDHLMGA